MIQIDQLPIKSATNRLSVLMGGLTLYAFGILPRDETARTAVLLTPDPEEK